jgi:hypothetical protein
VENFRAFTNEHPRNLALQKSYLDSNSLSASRGPCRSVHIIYMQVHSSYKWLLVKAYKTRLPTARN